MPCEKSRWHLWSNHRLVPYLATSNCSMVVNHSVKLSFLCFARFYVKWFWASWLNEYHLGLLFIVYSFNFKYNRSCPVRTTCNHCIFVFHPTVHYWAALQSCIDIPWFRLDLKRGFTHKKAYAYKAPLWLIFQTARVGSRRAFFPRGNFGAYSSAAQSRYESFLPQREYTILKINVRQKSTGNFHACTLAL